MAEQTGLSLTWSHTSEDRFSCNVALLCFQCEAGQATFQMFQSLSKPPVKNMLLGAGCSVATMPTAQVSHLFNLTQVSLLYR